MSRKALGRGLGDLLHRARPARAVARAAISEPLDLSQTPPSEPAVPAPEPIPKTVPHPVPPAPVVSGGGVQPANPLPAPPIGTPKSERPSPSSRLPRFGPSYSPPPNPAEPPNRSALYVVLVVDVLLIVFAALMAFGPWVQRPLAFYLAAVAVLAGGTLACGAIAYQATPHRPPTGSPKPSRVRVRLTRL